MLINKTTGKNDENDNFPHKTIINYINESSNEEKLSKMPAYWNPWF